MARNMEFNIVANDKATGTLKNVSKETEKFGSNVGKSVAKWDAVKMGIIGIGKAAVDAASEMGDIKDEAAKLGMTTEQFQRMSFAANQSGISIEQLGKGYKDLRNLIRDAGDAAQAGKTDDPKVKMLREYGFSLDEVKDKSIDADKLFLKMAEDMSALTDEQQKYEYATAIFGERIARDMIPILSNYNELRNNMAKAPVLNQEQVDQLDRAKDTAAVLTARAKQAAALTAASALGAIAGPVTETPAPPGGLSPDAAKQRALDIIKASKKPAEAGKLAVSSMAEIGGSAYRAAGMVAGKTATDHLEVIAKNTTAMVDNSSGNTDGTIPTPQATNFTNSNNDILRTGANVFKSVFGK